MDEKPGGRVLLAEDHTIVRQGLRALLANHDDITVVGEAADGDEAVRRAEELRPDIVVMDLGMPGLNGVDATRAICGGGHGTRVLVLSMHGTGEYVRPAVRAGASGYLVKGVGLSDLVTAIRTVAGGGAFFSPSAAASLLHERPAEREKPRLTAREAEVLEMVASGLSSPQIAEELDVSVKTVERHRSRIMNKLGVSNVAALVRRSIRLGLLDADGG